MRSLLPIILHTYLHARRQTRVSNTQIQSKKTMKHYELDIACLLRVFESYTRHTLSLSSWERSILLANQSTTAADTMQRAKIWEYRYTAHETDLNRYRTWTWDSVRYGVDWIYPACTNYNNTTLVRLIVPLPTSVWAVASVKLVFP